MPRVFPCTHDLYSELFVNKYPVSEVEIDESERGVYAYGDVFSASNTNSTEPYILEAEFKIDKDQAISLYNSLAYTNYANMPNAMYFSIGTHVYRAAADGTSTASQGYSRYLSTDVRGKSDNLFDYGVLPGSAADCLPYLIVFGDENTVITIPKDASEVSDTEVASTEVITTLPDQTLESVIETEETENNEEKEAEASVADESTDTELSTMGSCGSSVSLAGLALISVLGTCTVFVAKKKED